MPQKNQLAGTFFLFSVAVFLFFENHALLFEAIKKRQEAR